MKMQNNFSGWSNGTWIYTAIHRSYQGSLRYAIKQSIMYAVHKTRKNNN